MRNLSLIFNIVLFIIFLTFTTNIQAKTINYDTLPQWAKLILHIDVKQVVSDSFIMAEMKKAPEFKKLEKNLNDMGIDFYEDVLSVDFALAEMNLDKPQNPPHFIAYINVHFQEERLLSYIKKKAGNEGYKEEEIHNVKVIEFTKKNKDVKLALFENKYFILASKEKITEAIELVQGQGQTISSNSAVFKKMNQLNQSNAAIWAVFQMTSEVKSFLLKQKEDPFIKDNQVALKLIESCENIELLSFMTDLSGEEMIFNLSGTCKNTKSAKQLAESLISLKTMISVFIPAEIAQKLEVIQKGLSAKFRMTLTQADIDEVKTPKSAPPKEPLEESSRGTENNE